MHIEMILFFAFKGLQQVHAIVIYIYGIREKEVRGTWINGHWLHILNLLKIYNGVQMKVTYVESAIFSTI